MLSSIGRFSLVGTGTLTVGNRLRVSPKTAGVITDDRGDPNSALSSKQKHLTILLLTCN